MVFLANRVDVTPGGSSGWKDVNVSSYVPSAAAAAVVLVLIDQSYGTYYGVRANGSSDAFDGYTTRQLKYYAIVKLDSYKKFEVYQSSKVSYFLLGYFTTTEISMFTNAVDVTPSTAGSWVDHDFGSGMKGVVIQIFKDSTGRCDYGIRKNGSTDEYIQDICSIPHWILVGTDNYGRAELYVEDNSEPVIHHLGNLKSPAVFDTNMVDYSSETECDVWKDLPALPSGKRFGFYWCVGTFRYGVRPKGSNESGDTGYEIYYNIAAAISKSDSAGVVQVNACVGSGKYFGRIGYTEVVWDAGANQPQNLSAQVLAN